MAGLNSIMQIFVPKNKVFYDLFEKVATNSALMGNKLRTLVSEPDFDKRTAIINQIEDLEHANDELTHIFLPNWEEILSLRLTGKISTTWPLHLMILQIQYMLPPKKLISIK